MMYEFAQVFQRDRWLMESSALAALMRQAHAATPETLQAAITAYHDRTDQGLTVVGDVAVIPMAGPITYRASIFSYFFGGATIEGMQQQFHAALIDPGVKTILFRCDSPGGVVDMVPEFAEEIYAARGQKPIVAVADPCLCSAAYWLACQADTVYASASSMLGSIGVYLEHEDISEMLAKAGVTVTLIQHGEQKTDGHAHVPLTDRAKATLQAMVDDVGTEFDVSVARARGVSKKDIVGLQGQVFRGRQAIAAGLADKQGTYAQVLARLTKGRASSGMRAATVVTAAAVDHMATIMAAKKKAEMVEPEDGECPEGYGMGEDNLCHLMPPEEMDAKQTGKDTAEQDGAAVALAAEAEAIAAALAG